MFTISLMYLNHEFIHIEEVVGYQEPGFSLFHGCSKHGPDLPCFEHAWNMGHHVSHICETWAWFSMSHTSVNDGTVTQISLMQAWVDNLNSVFREATSERGQYYKLRFECTSHPSPKRVVGFPPNYGFIGTQFVDFRRHCFDVKSGLV